jgi:hypothetical protein
MANMNDDPLYLALVIAAITCTVGCVACVTAGILLLFLPEWMAEQREYEHWRGFDSDVRAEIEHQKSR